jgi:hypothetical protein
MRVWAILRLTGQECVRRPVFAILLLAGAAVILAVPFFTSFSFGHEHKMILDMGFATVTLCAVFLGILGASGPGRQGRSAKVLGTLLAKPVRRWEFVLGRFLGVAGVVLVAVVVLSLVLAGALWLYDSSVAGAGGATPPAGVARAGARLRAHLAPIAQGGAMCFLQAAILTAVSVALATRLGFVLNAALCVALYLLGHMSDAVLALTVPEASRLAVEQAGFFEALVRWPAYGAARLASAFLPGLGTFRVTDGLNSGAAIPYTYVVAAVGYALLYIGAALAAGVAALEGGEVS